MSAGRIIFCYFITCLPILVWFVICTYVKDYGVLMAVEILVCHILLPVVIRAISDEFYHIRDVDDRYYRFYFKGCEVELPLLIGVYIIGLLLLSFLKSSRAWNYTQKVMFFPAWKKNAVLIYAIFVALVAVIVYPVIEHYYYIGFVFLNLRPEKGYKYFIVIISLLRSIKWFFLFNETVQKKSAAVFWTILWVILCMIIDARSWDRNYHTGAGMKQVLMLMYVITLTLYALKVRCKSPTAVSVTRKDNKLS